MCTYQNEPGPSVRVKQELDLDMDVPCMKGESPRVKKALKRTVSSPLVPKQQASPKIKWIKTEKAEDKNEKAEAKKEPSDHTVPENPQKHNLANTLATRASKIVALIPICIGFAWKLRH